MLLAPTIDAGSCVECLPADSTNAAVQCGLQHLPRQLSIQATSLISVAEERYDRFWHFSEVPVRQNYFRFRMHCGRDLLVASLSANDPKRKFGRRDWVAELRARGQIRTVGLAFSQRRRLPSHAL
jgi:hypothetical protein